MLHRLDVKRHHPPLVLSLEERVHERLQRDRFAITRRSVEDQAAFPRHAELAILGLRVKEAEHSTCQRLLHLVVQDDVVPLRLLDLVVETPAAAPVAVIHQNRVLDCGLLGLSDGAEKRVRGFGVREDRFAILVYLVS